MPEPMTLDDQIDERRRELRADKIDITFGELASLYENGEMVVNPEYQRLFRWKIGQKTRFIESILLGIPTPAVFVAERDDGVWELVDGLQRLSTIFEFLGILKAVDGQLYEPLRLSFDTPRNSLSLLDGKTNEDLTLRSKLSIKRASCRAQVVKVGSSARMKFDLFERLNTGGSPLSPQEIRNCIFRSEAPELMDFVDRLADEEEFRGTMVLSDFQMKSKFDRGLVVRFFALRSTDLAFSHDVEAFVTDFLHDITEGRREFDSVSEGAIFRRTFAVLARSLGPDAFRYLHNERPWGGFSPSLFEAISLGVASSLEECENLPAEELRRRITGLKQDPDFREATGSGSNTRAKFQRRRDIAGTYIADGRA